MFGNELVGFVRVQKEVLSCHIVRILAGGSSAVTEYWELLDLEGPFSQVSGKCFPVFVIAFSVLSHHI